MVALPSRITHAQPDHPLALPPRPSPDTTSAAPIAADSSPALPEDQQAGGDKMGDPQLRLSLKDRAFTLSCEGHHSPAIAAQLGVSERTVRHWVHTALQQLAQDDAAADPDTAREQRALAIASQRAASASAWETYHRLSAAHNQVLALALNVPATTASLAESAPAQAAQTATNADLPRPGNPDEGSGAGIPTLDRQRLLAHAQHLASTAARYLALVISANREIARLQGQAASHAIRQQQQSAAQQLEADLLRAFAAPIHAPRPASLQPSPHDRWPAAPIPNTTPTADPAREVPTDSASLIALLRRGVVPGNTSALADDDLIEAALAGMREADLPPLQAALSATAAKTAKTATPPIPASPATSAAPAPAQTKIAAKTATAIAAPARPRSNHPPTIAIPSRAARKLRKKRT